MPALPIPPAVTFVAALLAAVFVILPPTALFVYVERRSRVQWAASSEGGPRRAPSLVRAAAWSGFGMAWLAVPLLVVPAACGGLLYAQLKLGVIRPVGLAATGVLGLLPLVQSLLSMGLVASAIRVLMNDRRSAARIMAHGRSAAAASGGILVSTVALSWAMASMPGLLHPWLRAALVWTAVRPIEAFAAAAGLQALLLWQAARVVATRRDPASLDANPASTATRAD